MRRVRAAVVQEQLLVPGGASHPEELVRVRELAIPALVLADRDGVYGVVRAHVAAGGRSSRAPRLIVGAQLTVVDFPEQAATGAGCGSGGAEAAACRRRAAWCGGGCK